MLYNEPVTFLERYASVRQCVISCIDSSDNIQEMNELLLCFLLRQKI
jgi:hypothetical protein